MGADYYVKYMIQLQAANDIGFGPKSPIVFGYSGEKCKYIRNLRRKPVLLRFQFERSAVRNVLQQLNLTLIARKKHGV